MREEGGEAGGLDHQLYVKVRVRVGVGVRVRVRV